MGTAMLETYRDSQGTITAAVRTHLRRHGGDPEELEADANAVFVLTYLNFDYKGAFKDTLYGKVARRLERDFKRERHRQKLLGTRVEPDTIPTEDKDRFDVEEFCSTLTQDAAAVVKLVFKSRLKHPVAIRAAVRRHLSGKLGWSRLRVVRAFQAVKERL
jgi:hypothetical protein